VTLSTKISSGTSNITKQSGTIPAADKASACDFVRGKPSNNHPLASQSLSFRRSHMTFVISSSGTSCPPSMKAFAFKPNGVPCLTAALKISPVDRWTRPKSDFIISHCVPFPAAGAPAMITFKLFFFGVFLIVEILRSIAANTHFDTSACAMDPSTRTILSK